MSATYRTIWISDLHLGTRGSDAEGILDFIKDNESETLYLVGDVVDLWALRREHYWPQSHNDVIQKILRKARKGTKVVYIPGNHDGFTGEFAGIFGNVSIKPHDLHVTADGKRLLVMHGHEFDSVTKHAKWLAVLGDVGYTLLLQMNRPLNYIRNRFGLGYWSLSAYVKAKVKGAVNYISSFEDAVVHYAELYKADGIICGHIHTPVIRQLRNVTYHNCGDWVESSTALVEHHDGRIELVRPMLEAEVAALTGIEPVFPD